MSVTSILVQLPSFSHSFSVSIPSTSTILDFKNEIARTCSGGPSAGGQRVIYKGRVLNDTEIVGEIWRAMDMPHTCHLAVHPSAWTATPPNSTSYSIPASSQPMAPRAGASSPRAVTMPLPTPHATYAYIQYMHTNALRILARQPRLPWPEQVGNMDNARAYAKRGIEASGRGWPTFLNQDFAAFMADPGPDEGVKYASVHIENLPYLSLLTPDATPTLLQSQAIRVLRYTFPLLCVYSPVQAPPSAPVQVHPLPPRPLLRVPAAIPRFPFRPLVIPLLLLAIRTILLLYFFQPARKPLFGLMVIAWVIWEIAGAVRGALGGENRQNNRARAAENPNAALAGARAGAQAGAGAVPGNRVPNETVAPRPTMNSHDDALNRLARINLATEAALLEPDSRLDPNTPPPSLSHKLKMFFTLLALTLHPAIWDRRRTALRAREGRVREEARTQEARALQRERERVEREENLRRRVDGAVPVTPDTQEPPPLVPRPPWVAEYMQRVRSGDWVDD